MINLLLQSIIAANPHHDSTVTPEVRLAQAREALLGEKPPIGRKALQEDLKLFPLLEEALKSEKDKMMRYLKSMQKPEAQAEWEKAIAEEVPSLRGIAKKYAAEFAKSSVQPESTEDWLRRAVKGMAVTSQDMADLEGFFYGDSLKARRLRRMIEELNAIGIACKDPIGTESDDLSPKQS